MVTSSRCMMYASAVSIAFSPPLIEWLRVILLTCFVLQYCFLNGCHQHDSQYTLSDCQLDVVQLRSIHSCMSLLSQLHSFIYVLRGEQKFTLFLHHFLASLSPTCFSFSPCNFLHGCASLFCLIYLPGLQYPTNISQVYVLQTPPHHQ